MDNDAAYHPYPLGHSERELGRLAVQARDLAAHTTVLFRRAGISAGHRVLDLGCGAGDVSFIAAELVGPGGHVIGIDRSPAAVEAARERARRVGHLNVTFKVGYIEDLALGGEFDAIVGRLVLMYLPDPAKALRGVQRLLRPHDLVVLQEGDPRTVDSEPECPLVSQIRSWMVAAFERTGCATNMGSQLGTVLHKAGYRPEGSWVSQPSYVGNSISRLDWFADLARTLAPTLAFDDADEAQATIARTRAASRLASIDILRGLIIVIMALDHVRDYFTEVRFNPLDPTQTTAILYATRWITNFCAPTFVLLAGVSAYFVGRRCTTPQLSRFLLTRGLWLAFLELAVISVEWTFNLRFELGPIMQVVWAIGMSMVVLSALVYLPVRVVGAIGVAICLFHNLLDGVPMPEAPVWA